MRSKEILEFVNIQEKKNLDDQNSKNKIIIETIRTEVNDIVEVLTNLEESEDFSTVARKLLSLREMLKNN